MVKLKIEKKKNKGILIREQTEITRIIKILETYIQFQNSGIGKTTIELIKFIYLDMNKEHKDLNEVVDVDIFNCPLFKYENLAEYTKTQISVLTELLTIYHHPVLNLDSIKVDIPKNLFSEIWNLADDKQIAQIIKNIPDGVIQVKCIILLSIQKLITKTLTELIASFGPILGGTSPLPFANWALMLYNLVYTDDQSIQSIQNIVNTSINAKLLAQIGDRQDQEGSNQAFINLVKKICNPDNIHDVDLPTSGINIINAAMQTIVYIPIIKNWTQGINTYLASYSFTLPNFTFWSNKKLSPSWDKHPTEGLSGYDPRYGYYYPIRLQVSHLHVKKNS